MKSSTGGEVAGRMIKITVSDFCENRGLTQCRLTPTMTHVGKLLNPNRIGEPQHSKRGFCVTLFETARK